MKDDHIRWSLFQVNANKGWLPSPAGILQNTAVKSVTVKHVAQCMICKSAGEESGTEGWETCRLVALKSGINWNSGSPSLSNLVFSNWWHWGFMWEFRHFQGSLHTVLIYLFLIPFPCFPGMGCCSQQRARLPLFSEVFRQSHVSSRLTAFPWAPLPGV